MKLFAVDHWLKAPAERDIIARWTARDTASGYEINLPQPLAGDSWEFLALGDSGDSDATGPKVSPQNGVAQQMVVDSALPGSDGRAQLVIHTGDVVYMTGERRLYDRNFRRPYHAFLTPESTVDNLVFRLPFLPVPGNHDYYDLGGLASWLSRVPILGSGIRALSHELFAFSLPKGGSDMGGTFMNAFVERERRGNANPLPYEPGVHTRLPNRYYHFRVGSVDFFALDSNTLGAPPPGSNVAQVRAEATARVRELEEKAHTLDRRLRRERRALDEWLEDQHKRVAERHTENDSLANPVAAVAAALQRLRKSLDAPEIPTTDGADARHALETAIRRWEEATADLDLTSDPEHAPTAMQALDDASDEGCAALGAVEGCLSHLADGSVRGQILASRAELERALHTWSDVTGPAPADLCSALRQLSEEALDVQRDLTLERRRIRYRTEDHDTAQLEWLDRELTRSQAENPDGWRVVYLHHPLYTTIANHCEQPDVQDLRENLLSLLKERVHLVISGHAHAFEWFHSSALPNTGLFVTGGGGQVYLPRSLMDPHIQHRRRGRYNALRVNGVMECAVAGRGPKGADGASGSLYHYLRIEVTPEALFVRPVGVRRLQVGYRREEPLPVYHVARLPEDRATWKERLLDCVEIRRDAPPRAVWE